MKVRLVDCGRRNVPVNVDRPFACTRYRSMSALLVGTSTLADDNMALETVVHGARVRHTTLTVAACFATSILGHLRFRTRDDQLHLRRRQQRAQKPVR